MKQHLKALIYRKTFVNNDMSTTAQFSNYRFAEFYINIMVTFSVKTGFFSHIGSSLQWAAVRTHCSLIREPPQWPGFPSDLVDRLTWYCRSLSSQTFPLIILFCRFTAVLTETPETEGPALRDCVTTVV